MAKIPPGGRGVYSHPKDYIQELNKDANPVILWSIVKGTIRNETISYSCRKKKKQHTYWG